ncbi:hypothetical protein F2Q68_00013269 [Brassica cretica]|uniref:F-box domain-containing protein n=2 Tax=Brassica cretica TaxID=69181 RepID=A0A8S9HC87_BRACR|nr:hypothetical protein F2Q68_00013269 [Brassica cretica]KAF3611348.1 hypothetical protein DY000_02045089 [Brassica cretica]
MDATSPPALPDDIIEEILLKLRVKELIRLKTLSKQCKSRIEFRSFVVRFHLDRPSLILMLGIFIRLVKHIFKCFHVSSKSDFTLCFLLFSNAPYVQRIYDLIYLER